MSFIEHLGFDTHAADRERHQKTINELRQRLVSYEKSLERLMADRERLRNNEHTLSGYTAQELEEDIGAIERAQHRDRAELEKEERHLDSLQNSTDNGSGK